jgi:hypothetical protein
MLKQIRGAMGNEDDRKAFEAFVEVDETYVGGRPRKENARFDGKGEKIPSEKEPSKRGRGTAKMPVIGVKERSSKRVYAKVALPKEKGQKLTGKQLLAVLNEACADGTTVISDDFAGYDILDKEASKFVHLSVNHSAGQFSAGNGVHTNNIEGFWAIFKRGWYGTYHHMSVKYLQRYIDEFCFRQNNRENARIFDVLLGQCVLQSA